MADMATNIADKLAQERRARLAAERLLDQKRRELFAANQQLALHAQALSDEIVQQRQGLQLALTEAESLKGENSRVRGDLERAHSVARIAQRRLWDALETIRDGFAVFDADLRLVAANRAYLSFFKGEIAVVPGVSYDAVLRLIAAHGMVEMQGRDAPDWHHEMVARIRSTQIPPYVLRTADGRHIRLIDRWAAAGDLVCLAQDITPTIAREAELEEARRKAEAASRAKSAFLANMSHEIRTPMNGVVSMAELLAQTDLTEDQRLFAETIRSSGDALLTIINDVLDYSKIDAERLRLYPEAFDLERCLHEVMMLLRPSAQEKGVTLMIDYDMFLPTRFVADPGRMRQIVTNLLGNAVKFTAAGHVLVRVVGFEKADGRHELHVSVEDTGIGIAPDHVEEIFGEFNQVECEASRRYQGTGLGLAITRRLVGLMGGTLWVDSEPGKGSCFGFRVVVPVAEPADPIGQPTPPITLRRAMVVDELLINRVILERQLETYGLEVALCHSCAEAARLLDQGAVFDVILVDTDTSGMGGAGLATKLHEMGQDIPVLLLGAGDGDAEGGMADGRMIGLRKPVLRSDLFHALQALSTPEDTAQPPAALPAPPLPTSPSRAMRILAAEDNRTNRLVLRKMVEDFDIELHFADNGQEAVALWRSIRPDLIFMDISMPRMDGRAAARAIRDEERRLGGHTPICALTAHAMDEDHAEIMAAGMDQCLTKPLRKSAIAARIEEHRPPDARPPLPAPDQAAAP